MPVDLVTFQAEVAAWSRRNFGEGRPKHALVGLVEELGELAEARGTQAAPEAATEAELVAEVELDLALACAAVLGRVAHRVLKGQQGIREGQGADARSFTQRLYGLLAVLETRACHDFGVPVAARSSWPSAAEGRARVVDAVGDLAVYLADFCRRDGLSLDEAVAVTWARVGRRDWVADPASGGEATEEVTVEDPAAGGEAAGETAG